MNTTDILKSLSLDRWHKVFIAFGAGLFIVSLITEVKVISNLQAILLSGGLFSLGVGEWMNEGKEWRIDYPHGLAFPGYTTSWFVWKPRPLGLILDVVGLFLLYTFINSLLGFPLIQPLLNSTLLQTPIPTALP